MNKLLIALLALLILSCGACCKHDKTIVYKAKETPDLLAQINGSPVYEKDLDARAQNQLYETRKQMIDQYIDDKLIGDAVKKSGYKDKNEFVEKEIKSKVKAPTEAEMKKFYSERKIPQPFDQIKPQLENYLKKQKERDRYTEVMSNLKKGMELVYFFTRPRMDIAFSPDDMVKGPKDALVTLVEYTDFQCPFCKRSQETLEKVLKEYSGKIKHVFRNFPLPMHANARDASNAALCAGEQNKFWEYKDILFAKQEEIKEPANFEKWAGELGLDGAKFKACLDSKAKDAMVQKDIDSGTALGISSTPTFFINGIVMSGARDLRDFEEIIEEELNRAKK